MTPVIQLTLVLSGAIVAAGKPAPLPFTEEAAVRGIVYVPDQALPFGDGLAFVDLDDDGDPDVVTLGRADGTVGVFENTGGGQFVDRSATSGIGPRPSASGVTAADYDRDGDLDLHVSRRFEPNALLRNDGGFTFQDVTVAAGLGDVGAGHGCAWADYDLDGRLDLYVANRGQPNRLYHNLGPDVFGVVSFEDVAVALGVDRGDDPTFQAAFFDFDHDTDPDLYLATDHGLGCTQFSNHLFENVNGHFVDITDEGTQACLDAMCVAIGDFDGNGWPDLYSTNTESGHALMLNDGGVFARAEDEADVAGYAVGWGSVFLDYDNDGHLDLYVCQASDANRLYRHDGAWPCVDMASVLGVDTGLASYTVAAADIEDDGDIDLLVMSRSEPIRLYVNHEGERRGWAKFDVLSEGVHTPTAGTRVEVRTADTWRIREVVAGSNYKAQNEQVVHVGLGDAAMIDEVRVTWPGGTSRTVANLSTRDTWKLYPPTRLGDADEDGDRDLDDFHAFVACHTGDRPGAVVPGCEGLDLEGDGDIDAADLALFLDIADVPQDDCNKNGIVDLFEILDRSASDLNRDAHLDDCQNLGDLDGDERVDGSDLQIVIDAWSATDSLADLDGDGVVGFGDLVIVLSRWGS